MNIFQSIALSSHLVGAAIVAVVLVSSVVIIWRRQVDWYRRAVLGLSITAAWQLVSGAILTWTTAIQGSVMSAGTYCRNFAVYMAIIVTVQAMLYWRMHENSQTFPIQFSFSSFLVGTMAIVLIGGVLYL